jgi:hypothetical protein
MEGDAEPQNLDFGTFILNPPMKPRTSLSKGYFTLGFRTMKDKVQTTPY